jgi:hypothetical protein
MAFNYNDLANLRYNPFTNSYSPVSIVNEGHTINTSSFISGINLITLFEKPQRTFPSSVTVQNTSLGYTMTEVPFDIEPASGEYRVCYEGLGAGIIEFNSADNGQTVEVSYNGLGTIYGFQTSNTIFGRTNYQFFTDTNDVFFMPAGRYEVVMISGGGGGSGGAPAFGVGSGGGASGAYAKFIMNLPTSTYTITIGSGGNGGTVGNNGNTGSSTSMVSAGILNLSLNGGGGGILGTALPSAGLGGLPASTITISTGKEYLLTSDSRSFRGCNAILKKGGNGAGIGAGVGGNMANGTAATFYGAGGGGGGDVANSAGGNGFKGCFFARRIN